jgi:hypothetical protein
MAGKHIDGAVKKRGDDGADRAYNPGDTVARGFNLTRLDR